MGNSDKTKEINILRLSSEGAGVGQIQGKTVFVSGMLPGEKGTVAIIEEKKNYLRAKLIELEEISPERLVPPCPVYEECGGCSIQHLNYEETLRWKQSMVQNALQRIGKVDAKVNPVIGMEEPWGYRNKATLHYNDRGKLGYYGKKSNSIVEFPFCKLLPETMNKRITELKEILRTGYEGVKEVVFRENASEETLIYVQGDISEEQAFRLSEAVHTSMKQDTAVQANKLLSTDKCSLVINNGAKTVASCGLPFLNEEINGLKFKVSYQAFQQVNIRQTEILYGTVLRMAKQCKSKLSSKPLGKSLNRISQRNENEDNFNIIWDLYCGIGTITLLLAQLANKVIGIEENEAAVVDAAQNALENKIGNVEFIEGKVEDTIGQQKDKPDLVVVDPPRAGMDKKVIARLLEVKPQNIICVSCDPATLARDVGMLVNGMKVPQVKGSSSKVLEGIYKVKEVQPVDMFGWTEHVETVVLMSRKDK